MVCGNIHQPPGVRRPIVQPFEIWEVRLQRNRDPVRPTMVCMQTNGIRAASARGVCFLVRNGCCDVTDRVQIEETGRDAFKLKSRRDPHQSRLCKVRASRNLSSPGRKGKQNIEDVLSVTDKEDIGPAPRTSALLAKQARCPPIGNEQIKRSSNVSKQSTSKNLRCTLVVSSAACHTNRSHTHTHTHNIHTHTRMRSRCPVSIGGG